MGARRCPDYAVHVIQMNAIVASHVPSSGTSSVCVAIRPEKIRISKATQDEPAVNTFNGELTSTGFLGGVSVYAVKLDGGAVLRVAAANATRTAADGFVVGQRVTVSFAPDDVVVLDR